MRKSRFLMNLIAVTAIGLSAVGCGSSSDQGSIQDTTDLSVPGNNNNNNERRNLREYMVVGQRGLDDTFAPEFANAGQSSPTVPGAAGVVAAPGDSANSDTPPALLFEIGGITDVPSPNFNPLEPGLEGEAPGVPNTDLLSGISGGFHQVYASPTGSYVIGMARSHNRAFQGDTVEGADLQIFQMNFTPADQVFPPPVEFGPVQATVDIRTFSGSQGEFVSGAWSSNAQQFYAAINGSIYVFQVNGNNGDLSISQTVPFPAGGGADPNNAAQVLVGRNGSFIFALDNANATLLTYTRAVDGSLTLATTTPTVSDPRGATLDRSGRFLYVTGRGSEQLAGYAVGDDGALTPVELFPNLGGGPVPFPFGQPLGDVAANPTADQLVLATYLGAVQTYAINTTTGALTATGSAGSPLNGDRNCGNVEFDPTGQFVVAAYEHDYDTFQPYVNVANGWPFNEGSLFANTDTATNEVAPLSPVPNFDALGRIVYVLPSSNPVTGSIQSFRKSADGSLAVNNAVDAVNPFGITFFQRVITPPASNDPVVP